MDRSQKEDCNDLDIPKEEVDVEKMAEWSSIDDVPAIDEAQDREDSQNRDLNTEKKEEDGAKPSILARTLSRKSAASLQDPGPPPDGGLKAWTQVVAAHLTVFSTWGWISSFGVFQEYYSETLMLQPSAISWLGSVQFFLIFFLGIFTGRALDAGLFRVTYIAGTVLQLLGIFSTSFATKYWQLFLSQALCMGIANGLQFCPALALASTYFAKKQPWALGLVSLGTTTGGVVFAVVVQQLLPKIGFGWTMRVCGFIVLFTNVICIAVFRTRLPPRKSGPLIEWTAFKELPFVLCVIGMFFNFWGLYFAFFYVGSYGRDILGFSYPESIDLLLTLIAVGIAFRLGPNYAAIYVGPIHIMLPFSLICCIMMFAWIGVRSEAGLYVVAALYGGASQGIQSMFPPSLASLTGDLSKVGSRMGIGFFVVSFASLTGAPLAGALIERDDGNYLYAQIWAGLTFLLGTSFLLAARVSKVGWKLKRKI